MKNLILFTLSALLLASSIAHAEVRSFTETAVLIDGAKFWFPSTIIVNKGDTVKLHLVSKVPGEPKDRMHGFAIDEFGIKQEVDDKGKDVEFVASKSGIFKIYCQMHPAHVGGQLVVQ